MILKFTVAVQNRFRALRDIQGVDDQWENTAASVTQAAEETVLRHCKNQR